MSRRRVWGVRVVALAVAAASVTACQTPRAMRLVPSRSGPPNVVIFVADDLGWGDIGVHGGRVDTPNIDRLFREGVEVDRFYVAPVCTPTRAGLLTGRSPIRFGLQYSIVLGWTRKGLAPGEHTMAEHLDDHGYQTAMVGKWHLGHARKRYLPNQQGFDSFYGHVLGGSYYQHIFMGGIDLQRDGRPVDDDGYATTLLGREMVAAVEGRDPRRPFFLYAPFYAPHAPFEAPHYLARKYRHLKQGKDRFYAGMIDAMDQVIGDVVAALRREGIARDTLVIFLSDNGAAKESSGSNGSLRGWKSTVYEGGIRVPAAFYWPGTLEGGRRSSQMMRDYDVLPTVLGAAGLEIDPVRSDLPLDGLDLWQELMEGTAREREPFFFAVDGTNARTTQRAAILGRHKLVLGDGGSRADKRQLYDIVADPGETRNIGGENPMVIHTLATRMKQWEALHPSNGLRHVNRPGKWKAPVDWTEVAR